jgi:exosortase A-associated hydrolase 1
VTIEIPVSFVCEGDRLLGIVHVPATVFHRGVLIVVGGPQYRIGSHRQFLLLARSLATVGVAVMRFDQRGLGDSEGDTRTFEDIDSDIRAAIDTFFDSVPELKEVAIWGLCDAASAALFYAHTDSRVSGIVLLNPWVRTEAGLAGAYLRHYYSRRVIDPNFWKKIQRGEFNAAASLRSLLKTLATSLGFTARALSNGEETAARSRDSNSPLPERMLDSWKLFSGRVLLILSGNDLTATEFKNLVASSRQWRRILRSSHVTQRDLPDADHTFSRREWRDQVATSTVEWVKSW